MLGSRGLKLGILEILGCKMQDARAEMWGLEKVKSSGSLVPGTFRGHERTE